MATTRLHRVGETHDGRRIVRLTPVFGLVLYRVAFGNGSTDVAEAFDSCCEWCGETPGRLYAYHDSLDRARGSDRELPGSLYCSLHCWGQWSGYTDL